MGELPETTRWRQGCLSDPKNFKNQHGIIEEQISKLAQSEFEIRFKSVNSQVNIIATIGKRSR